jgi:hypothetical protein
MPFDKMIKKKSSGGNEYSAFIATRVHELVLRLNDRHSHTHQLAFGVATQTNLNVRPELNKLSLQSLGDDLLRSLFCQSAVMHFVIPGMSPRFAIFMLPQ